VFTRNKPAWASGGKDIMLSGQARQPSNKGASRTFTNSTFGSDNRYNSWIEYTVEVYSVPYEIHYVAYDDFPAHRYISSNDTNIFVLKQKLFVALPGRTPLRKDSRHSNDNFVVGNYMYTGGTMGVDTCFVAIDTAGVGPKVRKMRKYITNTTLAYVQAIQNPVQNAFAYTMSVPTAGELTMWLCNTAEIKDYASNYQGMLFLDYIDLVPILPE
jgi:hypothetical protein